MPYPRDHAARSREKLLANAYKLFISQGYDATSIDEITEGCQLTRGAFYGHFKSKSQLYSEAIVHAARHSRLAGDKPQQLNNKTWIRELLASYLDKDTSAKPDWPCPLAFFATDIAHRKAQVRGAYTNAFASMSTHILEQARTYSQCSEATALAVTVMLIGAVAVARTLADEDLRRRLLESCEQIAVAQLQLA
jgi:AcrR family transcriptional regulator